jgi:hypothetical protein
MGMVPPETAARLMAPTGRERRRWDSLRPASPNGGECGWASSLLSYCDLARRRGVDRRSDGALLRIFERPCLVRVTGAALVEWRAHRNKNDEANG